MQLSYINNCIIAYYIYCIKSTKFYLATLSCNGENKGNYYLNY
ncbi:MAG: hypothetical protein JWQ66_3206 [Mucilaginibacter sp.]|nr:hypothetical protein [Mucilaginibacter sp.]